MARSDQTKSGDISLAEFIHYVREHEKNLRLQFTDLDKNKDGKILRECETLVLIFNKFNSKHLFAKSRCLVRSFTLQLFPEFF